MGIREKMKDFGSKIVGGIQKPKLVHHIGMGNPFAGMTKEQIAQKHEEFKAKHPELAAHVRSFK